MREHYQWNMDIVGLSSMAAEVELMSAQYDFLERVGFKCAGPKPEISFLVSNRQVLEDFLRGHGVTGEAFDATCVIVDKRDKIGDEATATQLSEAGISKETADKLLALLDLRAPELGDLLLQLGGRLAKPLLLLAGGLVQEGDVRVQPSQVGLAVGLKALELEAHVGDEVVEPRGAFREKVRQRLLGRERSAVADGLAVDVTGAASITSISAILSPRAVIFRVEV